MFLQLESQRHGAEHLSGQDDRFSSLPQVVGWLLNWSNAILVFSFGLPGFPHGDTEMPFLRGRHFSPLAPGFDASLAAHIIVRVTLGAILRIVRREAVTLFL